MNNKQKQVIEYLIKFESNPDIEALALFGSVARNEPKYTSDIDVLVITTDEANGNGHVLHPIINAVKLDISFSSYTKFEKMMKDQASKVERIPMTGESKILFDKTGRLIKLRHFYFQSKPQLTDQYRQFCKFMITHNNQKVINNKDNPTQLMFLIGTNLEDTLKSHYLLQGHWRIADKRILEDLKTWDLELNIITNELLNEPDSKNKLKLWTKLNKYIYKQNKITDVAETSCNCNACKKWQSLITG